MARGRVLIVDDEDVLCETMRLCLESEGFYVHLAGTAEAAMAYLSAESFDVAVLDILMPGANGAELIRRIRERRIATEIIVATSAANHDLGVEALRLGACEILRKPILNLKDKLVRSVVNASERYRLRKSLEAAQAHASGLERRINELYQLSRSILRAADDGEAVRLLDIAVDALYRPAPHILFRACGRELIQVGASDGLRLPFTEDACLPAGEALKSLALPPAVDVFPIESGRLLLGALAIGGLTEADSTQIVPLLALLPALSCHLLAARTRGVPAPVPESMASA